MKIALAGDTMLGRRVATALASRPPAALFAPEVVEAANEADLFVLNLECCISERGTPWPDPSKPFFFRAPPAAVEALALLGVDCVTLANNHALDFGTEALLDTFELLESAGIAWVGAGADIEQARCPAVLERRGFRLAVIGVTDHPEEYAAGPSRPGVAYDDLRGTPPDWLREVLQSVAADAALVTPHWGPNMTAEPLPRVRRAARALLDAGATLVAGHSAHVFQGVEPRVIYDLGDFVDDYATDRALRNDLGLLFLVTLEEQGPVRLEALPLELGYCHTRMAGAEDAAWIGRRFRDACARLGSEVREEDGRLVVVWEHRPEPAAMPPTRVSASVGDVDPSPGDELVLAPARLFSDRIEAGRALASELERMRRDALVVVGLARGGVQVAAEVARALGAPLDVVAVRKVGHPWQPEYGIGAVTPGDGVYLRDADGLAEEEVTAAVEQAKAQAALLDDRLHAEHPALDLSGKAVLVVDDGLATGATMIAALRWARAAGAARVLAALPVAAAESLELVRPEADELVCLHPLAHFFAVGLWYASFEPIEDAEVVRLIGEARRSRSLAA